MSGSKLLDDSSSAPQSESAQSPHPIGLTVYDLPPPGQEMVDAAQRTAEPGLYAIGDVTGGMLLAHKASRDAKVAEIFAAMVLLPIPPLP